MGAGLLGSMSVRFGMNTSGIMQGANQVKGILSNLGSMSLPGAAVAGVAAIGAAAIGIGVVSVKAAADFQQSMLKVQAYAGLTQKQTDAMSNSILSMAAKLGQSPKAMADAIYPIVSSGYSASQALNILELSAKTAAASGANMSTVADMLTTSLKASGAPASQAGHYMDMFNKIVSLGKGEVPAYAATIGKLTLAAGSAHVPFDQMGAALATLTTHGFPSVAQASNSLGNLFTQIGPKVDALATHAKKLGLSFNENAFKSMSLSQQLTYLQKVTGGNQGELLKLVGGSTLALKAFNALSGSGKDFTDNLASMKNATGATDSAFKVASTGLNASMARINASVQVLEIKIGQALLPAITKVTDAIAPLISQFAGWISSSNVIPNSINAISTGIKIAVPIIVGLATGIAHLIGWFAQGSAPALAIASGLTAIGIAVAAVKIGQFIATIPALLAGFGEWALSMIPIVIETLAIAAPYILIGLIVAAVVFAIIVVVKNWGAISAWLVNAWHVALSAIGNFFSAFGAKVHSILDAIGNFFHMVWNGILNFLKIVGLAILAVIIGPVGLAVIYIITHWTQVHQFLITIFAAIQSLIANVWNTITSTIHNAIMNIWNGINNFFGGLPGKMLNFGVQMIQGFISGVMSMAGNLMGAIGGLFSNLGGAVHGALHGAGIPGFANGVTNFSGGYAIVGERGPELVKLPAGSNVYPSGTGPTSGGGSSSQGGGGQQDIYIQLDSTTLAHVIGNKQARIVRAHMGRRTA